MPAYQQIADLLLARVKIRHIAETVRVSISTAYNFEGQISVGESIKRKLGSGGMNKKKGFCISKVSQNQNFERTYRIHEKTIQEHES